MKKFFLKRHFLFFVTLTVLVVCQFLICKNSFKLYKQKITAQANVSALTQTLTVKRKDLPKNHIEAEREMRLSLSKYRQFLSESWENMAKLQYTSDSQSLPANHVALFFELSNYNNWAKDSCESLGIDIEPTCSFGFRDLFDQNAQPLTNEIYDIHHQQEQLKILLSYLMESRSSYLKIISVERGDAAISSYFKRDDVFSPDTRQAEGIKSHVYQIKFAAFTNSFRNFTKNLYDNEIPVIFRKISISPNRTFKLAKNSPDQVLECLTSTFTVTVEFLDIPQNFTRHAKKNAAIRRKINYGTTP